MNKSTEEKGKKKGFWARLMEKMDKKLEERSAQSGCCCGGEDKGGSCSSK